MFYVKTKIGDGAEINVELYEDEIFSDCICCGKRMDFEPKELADILLDGGGFASTSIKCATCCKERGDD